MLGLIRVLLGFGKVISSGPIMANRTEINQYISLYQLKLISAYSFLSGKISATWWGLFKIVKVVVNNKKLFVEAKYDVRIVLITLIYLIGYGPA